MIGRLFYSPPYRFVKETHKKTQKAKGKFGEEKYAKLFGQKRYTGAVL